MSFDYSWWDALQVGDLVTLLIAPDKPVKVTQVFLSPKAHPRQVVRIHADGAMVKRERASVCVAKPEATDVR